MKVIFSRKGIDSSTRPCTRPSPQFPDGSFVSVPIPYPHSPVTYADVMFGEASLAEIVGSLMDVASDVPAHLDPDLVRASRRRRNDGWRPAFGQNSAALSHLDNQGVGIGDLFLFYGRFQPVTGPPWRYARDPSYRNGDFQAVWGWLRVGDRIDMKRRTVPSGNADHPHAYGQYAGENALFLAADRLQWHRSATAPGGGVLPRLRPLTREGATACEWWFDKTILSKHRQEHVGDCSHHPQLGAIISEILKDLS